MIKLPIRSQVVAPKDYYLLSLDLSKAETWVVAYSANEEKMKYELNKGDIHSATACAIFNLPPGSTKKAGTVPEDQYFLGKKSNHANSYRQSYLLYTTSVNKESDKPPFITIDTKEGKRHWTIWNQTYNLRNWWIDIEDKLKLNHFLINAYGRKRYFYGIPGNDLYKEGTAFLPQSCIADHLFGAVQKENPHPGGLKEIYKQVILPSNGEIRITNTSHDSIIVECPKESYQDVAGRCLSLLQRPMVINGEEFTVPADCEYGTHWGELEKVKL